MLNQMGDGGPFVFKEWDEAVGSMAMCEEATFVFSVGACQRAMMPFVACRKAPPGTVLVVEVGLINVKRESGRRQEVRITARAACRCRCAWPSCSAMRIVRTVVWHPRHAAMRVRRLGSSAPRGGS